MNNSNRMKSHHWIVLGIIIVSVLLVRMQFRDIPLERDEGEYAYMGRLLLEGVPPFSEAYTMKLPGTAVMYAILMAVFGQTVRGIHYGLILINCIAVLLVFFLASRFVSRTSALAAGAAYAVLSASPALLGFAAHATHFVALAGMGGTLLLLAALRDDNSYAFFGSGALYGLAFVMKQPGLFFLLFGASIILSAVFVARPGRPLKKTLFSCSLYILGGALPLLAVLFWVLVTGNFGKFWFWTVVYAARYGSQVSAADAFPLLISAAAEAADGFWLLWTMAFCGLIAALSWRRLRDHRVFIVLFPFFSFLTILPGFYFRTHYFITLLPAASISLAVLVEYLNAKSSALLTPRIARHAGSALFVAAVLASVIFQKGAFIDDDPAGISRRIYWPNPFAESPEVARFIESRTGPGDRIAVFGSEPQILFYAGRRSSTGYLYTYGLMERHPYALTMQEEMIREIEGSHPKIVVAVHVDTSWIVRPGSEKMIFAWFEEYMKAGYHLVGIVDLLSPEATVSLWDQDVRGYTVKSPAYLYVYERSGTGG